MIDSLNACQNPDGGWPYRPGGSSWTEPTVYALLAGYASGDSTGRARALEWLRPLQRLDGGWSPKPGFEQSTWVTSLVALLPVPDIDGPAHTRAIRWLISQAPANTTYYYRLKAWLNGSVSGESNAGFSWFPGTAGWSTPTALAILALARENRRNPDGAIQSRIANARRFLLDHRCADGGWNHGSVRALGVESYSYPETTGTVLLAFADGRQAAHGTVDPATLAPSVARAEAWWKDCPSSEAASWLMLGLRAAGRAKDAPPADLKARTVMDLALRTIAAAGDRGTEIFLG
jgi:hypothetical protein